MKRFLLGLLVFLAGLARADDYSQTARTIIEGSQQRGQPYQRLAYLCDTFGPRLSGSQALEQAIDWAYAEMRKDGLENVRTQSVQVANWKRGDERLQLLAPYQAELPVLGLGMSVGTPEEGIEADCLVVSSFDELKQKADQAAGKIVVFDAPFTSYGQTVAYRIRGGIEAARVGAVAALLRSVTPTSLGTLHTGVTIYDEQVPKIPFAAITVEQAEMMHRCAQRGQTVRVRLKMQAETLPPATSRNLIGELVGRESPEEVIVLGGHIDSWDVGQGAQDDGGGCLAAWEAVRLLKELGLRPRRTLRVVLFTNEENGSQGGKTYAASVAGQINQHVLAIESDYGVFRPTGFSFSGNPEAARTIREVAGLLSSIGADTITEPGGATDIQPLMEQGVPGLGLSVEPTRYFYYHHSPADTIDKVDESELRACVATMAVMAYVVADMPVRLPFGSAK
ncbi:MAG: M20/M25/M40 family metallo-hydrolase [Vulcanimicrobiota bacterium]